MSNETPRRRTSDRLRHKLINYTQMVFGWAVMVFTSNLAHHMVMHSDHSHPIHEWAVVAGGFVVGLFFAFPHRAGTLLDRVQDAVPFLEDPGGGASG